MGLESLRSRPLLENQAKPDACLGLVKQGTSVQSSSSYCQKARNEAKCRFITPFHQAKDHSQGKTTQSSTHTDVQHVSTKEQNHKFLTPRLGLNKIAVAAL